MIKLLKSTMAEFPGGAKACEIDIDFGFFKEAGELVDTIESL